MKNAMQLKAIIRKIAQDKHISAQLILQNYMIERLLERVSCSEFVDKLILKGGFLIEAIVGLDSRATMDIDVTVKNYPVTEHFVHKMFNKICSISLDDNITFELIQIVKIREKDEYNGYRVAITANYPPLAVPLKIDITTGDIITPKEIEFTYQFMFENKKICLLAYNVETLLAEKLETIISRGDQNTRLRDFYDVYILYKLKINEINFEKLKKALIATSTKRGTLQFIYCYDDVVLQVKNSRAMIQQWKNYQKNYYYAQEISFKDICSTIIQLMKSLLMKEPSKKK